MNASYRFLCRLSFYKTDLQTAYIATSGIVDVTRIKLPITLIIFVGLGKILLVGPWDVATCRRLIPARVPGVLPRVLLMY